MNATPAASPAPDSPRAVRCRERRLPLDAGPHMVGILNVSPDSFFDGGHYGTLEAARAQARRLVAEGATVLDIGGQSTRPGYREISVAEEIDRVAPLLARLAGELDVALSIDTYKVPVAQAALSAGAHLVNDIHGLQGDPAMAPLIAAHGAAAIVMHHDLTLREQPATADLPALVLAWLDRSLACAAQAGIARDQLILDPGIGFGKTPQQNLALLAQLAALSSGDLPWLLGVSRKSCLGYALGDAPPGERLEATLAATALAVWQGVHFHRVHDVAANLRAARLATKLRQFRPASHS